VAARGIPVDDIAHVVNYDLPQEPENFIHRVGRTGRAGARGASWTFVTPLERSDVRAYERTTAAAHWAGVGCAGVSGFDERQPAAVGQRAKADNDDDDDEKLPGQPPASLK